MGEMTTEQLIEYYERHLRGLHDEETFDTEAQLVLVARDDIADQWAALTPRQRQRVYKLDDVLISQHPRVATVLPSRASTDRSRWWWHLHEGPHVREDTLAASRRE